MSSRLIVVALLAMLAAVRVDAQSPTTFEDVQYISGKDGFDKKIKGQLRLSDAGLQFTDDAKVVFTIALVGVTKVSNAVENNPGSTLSKGMFGGGFANHSDEFVYVTAETAGGAEGLVFKVKKKTSPGIVAKIEFAAKKAKS